MRRDSSSGFPPFESKHLLVAAGKRVIRSEGGGSGQRADSQAYETLAQVL